MKLSGSQIIIEVLIEQGCDCIFGYPGGQVINIYDALYEYKDRIKHVLTAHEQGASHAADGYKGVYVCNLRLIPKKYQPFIILINSKYYLSKYKTGGIVMRKVAKFFSGLLSASLAFNFAAPAVSQYIAAAETEIASLSEVIRAGFENYETSIDISRFELTAEDVPRIVEVINYVRTIPELFYISVDGNGTVSQVQKEGTSDYIIGTLNVKYNNTYEEAKPLIEEFNAKADEIISEVITDDMTELQKALKLHDYLVLNTVYDTKGELEDLNGGSSAYDILVCGNGICQGYAQAYNVLL